MCSDTPACGAREVEDGTQHICERAHKAQPLKDSEMFVVTLVDVAQSAGDGRKHSKPLGSSLKNTKSQPYDALPTAGTTRLHALSELTQFPGRQAMRGR
jgi:hypothetical protein